MPSDISEKNGFVHAAISGIEGHELNNICQPRPECMQDRIDVPHDHSRLGSQIKSVQRFASGRLVDLPSHKGHLASTDAVLESQMLIPIPVALGPGIATCGHRHFLKWFALLRLL